MRGKRVYVDKDFDNWLNDNAKEMGITKKALSQKIPDLLKNQGMIIQRLSKKKVNKFDFKI